jgi:ComF family protein
MSVFSSLIDDFLSMVYPLTCSSCGERLTKVHEVLCISCDTNLPKTHYHMIKDNILEKKFWGRCELKMATAMLFFEKDTIVQSMLHEIKYKNNEPLGLHLGTMYANDLFDTEYRLHDIVIPVPLHTSKLRSRGYNQCTNFSKALAQTWNIEFDESNLYRKIANPSQTTKSRLDRWDNVSGIFDVKDKSKWSGKKIVLIDDVVTTGATIEACVDALAKCNPASISLISIAVAKI